MKRLILIAAALVSLGAGAKPAIQVSDAHVRPIPPDLSMTAGYMTLRNVGDKPDRLLSIRCACAEEVTAHETMQMGGRMGPMSHMQASGPVTIPAKGAVTFAPGGRHLMLMGVKGGIKPGQRVMMTLRFEHGGEVSAPFVGKP
jgi:copper(I)-binding protein